MGRKRQDDADDRAENQSSAAGKSRKATILLLLAGGGVLLVCCFCGSVGTGGWFFRDKIGFGASAAVKPQEAELVRGTEKPKGDGFPAKGDGLPPKGDDLAAKAGAKGKGGGALGKWKEVRAEAGKFVIELPTTGVDDKSMVGGVGDLMVQAGGTVKNHLIGIASTKRMGKSASEPAKSVAENAAQMPAYKNKRDIELQGHPGVERRSDDGKTVARCYVSGTRVYIITVTTQGNGFDQAVADRVFNSFKILE